LTQNFYRIHNIEEYTIRVHALKSSSRIIGASALSEQAAMLEKAGKEKNFEYIEDNTSDLLKCFRDLASKLKVQFSEDTSEGKEKISPDKLLDAYNTIYELAQMMDYDSLELIFDSLKAYTFEDKDRSKLEKIKSAMDELNWDGVLKAVKESL
jgi:hypothetical protein